MNIFIRPDGTAECLYDELIDVKTLGDIEQRRAAHVEPDGANWTADMRPSGGPVLGPFGTRSEALAAERAWLDAWLLHKEK